MHLKGLRNYSTEPAPKDAISIIVDQSPDDDIAESVVKLEASMVGCIRDEIEDMHPNLRMVPPDELRRVAFSELSLEEIRPTDWSWKDLLFQERIAPLSLRYLIQVTLSEWKDKPQFYPFIVGQKRHAKMHADIVDLKHTRIAGTIDVAADNATAAGIVLAGGGGYGVAFPWAQFPSAPRKHACSKLGEGVAKFLAGESLPAPGWTEESPKTEAKQLQEIFANIEEDRISARTNLLFKHVAGTWSGTIEFGQHSADNTTSRTVSMTIKEDGSYEAVTSSFHYGDMQAIDGKIHFDFMFEGQIHTVELTLHESEGQRVLKGSSLHGSMLWEMTPVGERKGGGS